MATECLSMFHETIKNKGICRVLGVFADRGAEEEDF